MIEFKATKKGFLLGKFKDRYGAQCSLQESSYQEEECVWVGVERDVMGDDQPNGRMHLTREMARDLAETLLYFANEGSLGRYSFEQRFRVGAWVRGIGRSNYGVLGRITTAHIGDVLVVQDHRKPGEDGCIICTWDIASTMWVPTEPPPEGRTIYEHLEDDDDL